MPSDAAKLGGPQDLDQSLRRFLASHSARTIERDGRPWQYLVAGRKAPAQLVLPGAVGNAESTFLSILELESDFRLLAPSYPAVATKKELVEGIAAILTAEGMEELGVIGGSYGAAVAQCFVHRYPDRVSTLILSHGGVPRPDRARRTR
ncbi:MAG: alpha/beta hydrolase, partial [Acidobacteria bacterium]|nr:alpha/beta hydrolase [Acidobacteriota bacterium]